MLTRTQPAAPPHIVRQSSEVLLQKRDVHILEEEEEEEEEGQIPSHRRLNPQSPGNKVSDSPGT